MAERKYVLCVEDQTYELNQDFINLSQTLKDMADVFEGEELRVPLEDAKPEAVQRIISWVNLHSGDPKVLCQKISIEDIATGDIEKEREKIDPIDRDWIAPFSKQEIYDIMTAANFLQITPILIVCAKTIASILITLSPEEIRQEFGVENDYTPEEEQKVIEELRCIS